MSRVSSVATTPVATTRVDSFVATTRLDSPVATTRLDSPVATTRFDSPVAVSHDVLDDPRLVSPAGADATTPHWWSRGCVASMDGSR